MRAAASLMLATSAKADRPGTPTDMELHPCRDSTAKKPTLCGSFINRADEEVTFEYEFAFKNSRPMKPTSISTTAFKTSRTSALAVDKRRVSLAAKRVSLPA